MRSVQGVNPQTFFFFFFLWVATRRRPVGCAGFVLPPAAPYLGLGGHWERKASSPLLLCGPGSLLPDHRSCCPLPPKSYDLMTLPRSLPETSCQLFTLLPWLHQSQPLTRARSRSAVSHLAVWDRFGDFLDDSSVLRGLSSSRTIRDGELGEVSIGSLGGCSS